MIIDERSKFIKKFKLNSNINKFVFAKTLFAMNAYIDNKFLNLVANTIMNRFIVEIEISDDIPSVISILTSFDCWKNLKFMDSIDINNENFQKCLKVASEVLSGKLNENFSSVLSFHKKSESHLLTNNIQPKFEMNGFAFFDVYI